jgi:hypothetical protein
MKWVAKAKLFNAAVAVLAVLAWFAGTNHCALGLIEQPQKTAVPISHCPEHSGKADGNAPGTSGMLACCQGLLSSNIDVSKAKISFSPVLLGIQLFAISHLVLPEAPKSILLSTEYDTGPPSASFFLEAVLRRSLCENAPPLLS